MRHIRSLTGAPCRSPSSCEAGGASPPRHRRGFKRSALLAFSIVLACGTASAQGLAKAPPARPESNEFAVVDRFQLWASCAAVGLPTLSEDAHFEYARLRLADGSILPWLIVEDTFFPEQHGAQAIETWRKRVDELRRAHNSCVNCQGPRVNPQAVSYTYRTYPCDNEALQFTVVTAVFRRVVGKTKSAEVVVMFGDRSERANGVDANEATRKAFQLTTKVIGQAAKPDTHRMPGDTADVAIAPRKWIDAAATP